MIFAFDLHGLDYQVYLVFMFPIQRLRYSDWDSNSRRSRTLVFIEFCLVSTQFFVISYITIVKIILINISTTIIFKYFSVCYSYNYS